MKNSIFIFSILAFLSSCVIVKTKTTDAFNNISEKGKTYDAIIVPGVPYDGVSWSDVMRSRVRWSVYLYKNGYTDNIIYSGSSVYSPFCEAHVMALYAEALGVPKTNIYIEKEAEHSTENVYYSFVIAKDNGLKNVALATDPFQNSGVRSFIKKHDLPIEAVPIVYDSLISISPQEPKIQPMVAYNFNFKSIKDREGFFKRLSGTFGKNIIWHEEDLPSDKLYKKYSSQGRVVESKESAQRIN